MSAYTPKTGAACGCQPGIHRDNCPNCEGTGRAIDFRAIHAARKAQTVTRYVVTHLGKDGLRTLTQGAQGRYTYGTREEAEKVLRAFEPSYREWWGGSSCVGVNPDTLEVCACDCWPDHFDPKGVYFD